MDSDKTAKVRKGEELDAQKLDKYLKMGLPAVGNIVSISQFPGGFSNLTYLIQTEHAELVLRRPPFGASIKSGHDMGREFRVLSALPRTSSTPICAIPPWWALLAPAASAAPCLPHFSDLITILCARLFCRLSA